MSIEQARQAREKMRAEGVVLSVKSPRERNLERDTRKSAIDAMCFHCIGEEKGYRRDIRECTAGPDSPCPCPLYKWRPYK